MSRNEENMKKSVRLMISSKCESKVQQVATPIHVNRDVMSCHVMSHVTSDKTNSGTGQATWV